MATNKKPTAKQLAARAKFAKAVKSGAFKKKAKRKVAPKKRSIKSCSGSGYALKKATSKGVKSTAGRKLGSKSCKRKK